MLVYIYMLMYAYTYCSHSKNENASSQGVALMVKSVNAIIANRKVNFRSFLNKCCNVVNSSRLGGHLDIREVHRYWFRTLFVKCSAPSHYLDKFLLIVDVALKTKFRRIWSNGRDAICSQQPTILISVWRCLNVIMIYKTVRAKNSPKRNFPFWSILKQWLKSHGMTAKRAIRVWSC